MEPATQVPCGGSALGRSPEGPAEPGSGERRARGAQTPPRLCRRPRRPACTEWPLRAGAAAPRVPAGHPSCKGPAPGLGGGRPSRGSAGQGAAARESARAHSRTGLAAEQVTGATCCAASRPWTRQRALTGSRSPKGVRGEPAAHLSPSRLVGFRLNASARFLLFQASLCRQKKITNTPICTFPLSRVRDVRQLRSRRSPLVPPTRAGCPSPSARSGRPRPFPV